LQGPSWSWLYGSWIYNYLCNQCLTPITLWVRITLRWGVQHYVINLSVVFSGSSGNTNKKWAHLYIMWSKRWHFNEWGLGWFMLFNATFKSSIFQLHVCLNFLFIITYLYKIMFLMW
jgi:hypothetical protein